MDKKTMGESGKPRLVRRSDLSFVNRTAGFPLDTLDYKLKIISGFEGSTGPANLGKGDDP